MTGGAGRECAQGFLLLVGRRLPLLRPSIPSSSSSSSSSPSLIPQSTKGIAGGSGGTHRADRAEGVWARRRLDG